MKDLNKRAKEIIEQIRYITIASVTENGMPWNSPVFAAYDEDYNFYFGTHTDSQKAKNIKNNPNVFITIYDSTVPPGTGEGVYIKATVQQINDLDEIKRLLRDVLMPRHDNHFWDIAAISGDGPVRLYKATPQKAWMNDDGQKNGHYVDIRTEIQL
jgi:general stress protein 26